MKQFIRSFPSVLLYLLLTAAAPPLLHAEDEPGAMEFSYTYHTFAFNDSLSLVEFQYQFSEEGLRYVKEAAKPGEPKEGVGKLHLRLSVVGALGIEVLSTEWITGNRRAVDAKGGRMLMGLKTLALHPGPYRAKIVFRDMAEGGASDSATFTMIVRDYSERKLQVSDVELIAGAEPSEDESDIFYKNGYAVLPNVAEIVAAPMLVVNAYFEIYNANLAPTSEYNIQYMITDTAGRLLHRSEVTRARPSGGAVMELFSTTVEDLPSGDYYLGVTVYGGYMRSATDSMQVMKYFALRNPERDMLLARAESGGLSPLMHVDVVDPVYAGMKVAELDLEFTKIRPIIRDEELAVWRGLDGAEAKGRFLTQFWLKRDETIGTVENENRDDYMKLVEKARNLYNSPMSPNGWDSDRGRVLLKYGEPNAIERRQNEYNEKPYQIWHYSQLGYDFVFVDRTETSTFQLVHSTAPGERRFENWKAEYATMHKSQGSQGTGNYPR